MTLAWVLTPQISLGEMIGESLASLGVDARVWAKLPAGGDHAQPPPALLVMDAEADAPERLASFVAGLRESNPRLRLVLLEATESSLEGLLTPDLTLPQPFYLPDFLAAVENWLKEEAPLSHETTPSPSRPRGLGDATTAAQRLARLSLETAAQAAALVTLEGKLWAYAGELPQPAVEELARLVSHYWEGGKSADLARFLRLEAMQQDYLLYVTSMTADLLLAMLFDVEVPFSRIRAQAERLAQALAEGHALGEGTDEESAAGQAIAPPEKVLPEDALPLSPAAFTAPSPSIESGVSPQSPPSPQTEEADLPPEAFEPLFDEVPPPNPDSLPPSTPPSSQQRAAPPSPDLAVEVAEPKPSVGTQPQRQPVQATGLPASPLPLHATVFYACVLVPRFPQHQLTGDLARDLGRWLPQIAIALGWRLLHLAIRPDHLHWVVQAPPKTSAEAVPRAVREHTSQRIFAAYPRIAELNIGDDFWAPGYLLLSQNQPIADETVAAFIAATRRHQGLTST